MEFSFSTAFIIVAIIIVGWIFINQVFLLSYCKETSTIDGEEYNVQCDYPEKDQAANLLQYLNTKAEKLIDYVYNKYKDQKSDRGGLARNLHKRYRGRTRLVETDPANRSKDTAYVLDKGWLLSLCIRTGKNKDLAEFHKKNFLTFVLIHELSHIASNVEQHPKRFWECFKWLLYEAKNNDPYDPIYRHINFNTDPVNYCNILKVTYTPENDDDLRDIQGALTEEVTTVTYGRNQEYNYQDYEDIYDDANF